MITGAVVTASATAAWLFVSSDHPAPEDRIQPGVDARTTLNRDANTAPRPTVSSLAPAPVDAPAAPLVVLTGVVVAAGGVGNLAIVSVDRRPEMLIRVGDALGVAATVVRIDDDSMTYRIAGNELLVLVKQSPNVAATAKPHAAPKQYPGFVAAAPAMARGPGSEPGSGNEAFRQAVEKKFQAIASGR